jgi:hypothetical protein
MKFFGIISAIFREIFDQAAYERFCLREGMTRGRESYADFLRQSRQLSEKKIRCC